MQFIINNFTKILMYIGIYIPIYIFFRYSYLKIYKKDINKKEEFMKFIFYLYIFTMITLTILISLPKNLKNLLQIDVNWKINTTTFLVFTHALNSLKSGNYQYILINLLGNIAAFIPMGILLPMIYKKKRLFSVVVYGFVFSMCIELSQLLLFRATDVDDVMLNTLGTLIGYLIYRFIIK